MLGLGKKKHAFSYPFHVMKCKERILHEHVSSHLQAIGGTREKI